MELDGCNFQRRCHHLWCKKRSFCLCNVAILSANATVLNFKGGSTFRKFFYLQALSSVFCYCTATVIYVDNSSCTVYNIRFYF